MRRASVINVSQLFTIDKSLLTEQVCAGSAELIHQLDIGLKLVLGL